MRSLADTVEAFLGFQNISKFATQSWAAVHRALSSALLLGIVGESAQSERVRGLISKLTAVMSDLISTVDPSELSVPLVRSVTALHKFTSPSAATADNASYSASNVTTSSTQVSSPRIFHSDSETTPYEILNSIFWGSPESILLT